MGLVGPYESVTMDGETKLVHRIRAEKALGKPLPRKAVVHHADGSTDANAPLVICQDQRYHFLLHVRERVLRAGGDPNTQRICWRCKELKTFKEFYKDPLKTASQCRKCTDKQRALNKWKARRRLGARMLKDRTRDIAD